MESFHEELPEELKNEYDHFMTLLNIEKLSGLVEIMHEFLLLHVAKRESQNDANYMDQTNVRLVLSHRSGDLVNTYTVMCFFCYITSQEMIV